LAETSSTEKLTATMVASLPIRKLASLASLTSSVLGDPRAEATTSRARPSFWAHTCTTASSLTSNTCSCMIMVGPPPVCPVQLSNSGFVNSVTSRDTRIFLGMHANEPIAILTARGRRPRCDSSSAAGSPRSAQCECASLSQGDSCIAIWWSTLVWRRSRSNGGASGKI